MRLNINDDSDDAKADVLAMSTLIAEKLKNVTTLEIACDDIKHLEKLPALPKVTNLRMGFGAAQPALIPGLAVVLKEKYSNVKSLYISFGSLLNSVAYNRFALLWIEHFRDALYDQEFNHLRRLWVECDICHLHTLDYRMEHEDRVFRDHIYWCRNYKH